MTALIDAVNGLLQAAAPLVLLGAGAMLVIRASSAWAPCWRPPRWPAASIPLQSLMSSALQLQMLAATSRASTTIPPPARAAANTVPPPRTDRQHRAAAVSFRYARQNPLVVRDVTSASSRASLAIVGRSGSGSRRWRRSSSPAPAHRGPHHL